MKITPPSEFLCGECKLKMAEYYKLSKRETRRKLKIRKLEEQENGKINIKK
jgi:hypothetical protein